MNDYIRINLVHYPGRLIKSGTRNHHPMSAYVGKRVIDVAREPSDDSWTNYYVFESSKPLPVDREVRRLEEASWMDVGRDDCEAPGQMFRRGAIIRRMTRRRILITQSEGRDI